MKPLPSPEPGQPSDRLSLLREALDVLKTELSILAERRTNDLPELKKKKVVVASRLGTWEGIFPDGQEASDLATLESLVTELEARARLEIRGHLALLGHQVYALQDEQQYWRECLNISFGKFARH